MPNLIPFVKQEQAELARKIERKLLALSPDAGILFVGVSVDPTVEEEPIYRAWIGCSRKIREDLVPKIIDVTLREELESGVKIKVEAHRGCVRP